MEDAEGFTAVRRKRRPLKAAGAAAEGAAAAEASVDSEPIEQIDESTEAALLRPMAAEAAAAAEAAEGAAEGGEDEASEGAEDMDQEADTSAAAAGGAPQQQKGPRKGGPRKQLIDKEKEHKEEPFIRRLPVPQHRYTPLRQQWIELIKPLIMHMRLQVRMNLKRRCVELRAAPPPATPTQTGGALGGGGGGATAAATYMQKGEDNIRLSKGYDYIRAFLLGFEQRDCLALLRLDDMYLESFEIQDVKRLNGAHLSR
ncbi:RNA-binding protein PNO1, related [Eimeria maxima]|uniref:RNA-binding protein PNO1, related n=1 Tax=Eimeria maxima TaxID=5804 RepID=U6LY78_EIMMA|nr:RNA-binding protein PNO1, related [Eimeria maxima]CDJ56917.1 RNA-binding protein PNO1, related [Eimeria maxima]